MSYITDKFDNGEVKIICRVHGWYFEEGFNGEPEHRPLMEDAMQELLETGRCTETDVIATRYARDIHMAKSIEDYKEARAARTAEQIAEERFEMLAAFGEGETVVNILTGETTKL